MTPVTPRDTGPRIGCLLVEDLPVAAQLRAEPELAGVPFAVVSEAGPRAVVLGVSPEAARAGIPRRGATLSHARSVCAELRVRLASPAGERAAREALRDVALSVSPRVALAPRRAGELAGEALVHLDASGQSARFASEEALAGALVARAHALGLPAVAAVASSRAVAELAARQVAAEAGPGAVCVVAPGREAAFLAPLPVDRLHLDDALAATLTRFGIHRLGPLLALPPRALATRLGPEAVARLAPLRGEGGAEPPIPAPRDPRLEEGVDLEAPVDRLEPLAFALAGPLARLLGRLAVRHLACAELELRLDLDGARRDVRRVRLAAPSAELQTWLRRLRAVLAADPPRAPVEGLTLAAEGQPLRRDQLDLFRPAGPAPARLDALVAELSSLCGEDRVGIPRVPDDVRPGAWAIAPFPQGGGDARDAGVRARRRRADRPRHPDDADDPGASGRTGAPHVGASPHALAVRALRPAVPAEVRLRAGRPAWLRSALANGEVVHCAGPWRTTGGWWSEERRFAYDSFDVATDDGLLVRLRYDHLRRAWEIDGLYD